MKKLRIFNTGHEVEFLCESRNTRYGFAHDAHLMIDGADWGTDTIRYLNRTWESFAFQTVCMSLCDKVIEGRKWLLKERYKAAHGIAHVATCAHKAALAELIARDKDLALLAAIRTELKEGRVF